MLLWGVMVGEEEEEEELCKGRLHWLMRGLLFKVSPLSWRGMLEPKAKCVPQALSHSRPPLSFARIFPGILATHHMILVV